MIEINEHRHSAKFIDTIICLPEKMILWDCLTKCLLSWDNPILGTLQFSVITCFPLDRFKNMVLAFKSLSFSTQPPWKQASEVLGSPRARWRVMTRIPGHIHLWFSPDFPQVWLRALTPTHHAHLPSPSCFHVFVPPGWKERDLLPFTHCLNWQSWSMSRCDCPEKPVPWSLRLGWQP